jgi:hypothetical protein
MSCVKNIIVKENLRFLAKKYGKGNTLNAKQWETNL